MTIQSYQKLLCDDRGGIKPFRGERGPFLSSSFFSCLQESGCIGAGTGWDPHYFYDGEMHFSYLFAKSHSYGEYIFDWAWAQAFERYGKPYYPKLTSMIPLTSATSSHLTSQERGQVDRHLDEHFQFYQRGDYSSLHYLFITQQEREVLEQRGFRVRESFQYHFFNEGYSSFEDLLSRFKGRKAKQVRKERRFGEEMVIEQIRGDDLTPTHAHEMWNFYIGTIAYKGSMAYLNQDFFIRVFEQMKHNILYVRARLGERAVAGSLFFFNDERLYGRYWGTVVDVKNLHFELCYYQGIDFCLREKLKVFEAGAQGEHKMGRGFVPVRTYSAHHIKDATFRAAIDDFIERERMAIAQHFTELQATLPYR